MSRVTYTPLREKEDPRGVSRVNEILQALEDGSNSVDSKNFAEEGQDGRSLQQHAVAGSLGFVQETTRAAVTLASTVAFATLVFSGTTFQLPTAGVYGFPIASWEVIRVRCRVFLETTAAAGLGLAADSTLELQLYWYDGATLRDIPLRRPLGKRPGSVSGRHGVVFTEGYITGPQSNIDYIQARYLLVKADGTAGGGPAFPANALLWATRFNRIEDLP